MGPSLWALAQGTIHQHPDVPSKEGRQYTWVKGLRFAQWSSHVESRLHFLQADKPNKHTVFVDEDRGLAQARKCAFVMPRWFPEVIFHPDRKICRLMLTAHSPEAAWARAAVRECSGACQGRARLRVFIGGSSSSKRSKNLKALPVAFLEHKLFHGTLQACEDFNVAEYFDTHPMLLTRKASSQQSAVQSVYKC